MKKLPLLLLLLLLPLLLIGCQRWVGCEYNYHCNSNQTCELDTYKKVGTCISEEEDYDDSYDFEQPVVDCTEGDVPLTRLEIVYDGFGNQVAYFNFSQVRYSGPEPCATDWNMTATLTNPDSVPLTMSYQIDFINNQDGRVLSSYRNTSLNVAPGATVNLGTVFPSHVNLMYMNIGILANFEL